MKMSIWLPGGGYFYTRHPFLGFGDFVVEAFLIFNVVLFVTQAIESGDPAQWFTAGFFGVALVVEKLISIYHANRYIREYIPIEQPVKRQSARHRRQGSQLGVRNRLSCRRPRCFPPNPDQLEPTPQLSRIRAARAGERFSRYAAQARCQAPAIPMACPFRQQVSPAGRAKDG